MARNDGLRDYQQEMKLRLFEEWELHRSVMVQMPTGTGKTHLLAAVVKEFLCGVGVGMRVWIVAHRRELVEQIEETVARYGMGKEPDKTKYEIYDAIKTNLPNCGSWNDLELRLKEQGISAKCRFFSNRYT